MSPEEMKQRLLFYSNSSWDSRAEEDATIDDLDKDAIQQFLNKLNSVGRRAVPVDEDPIVSLRKLRLIENDKPTRAAILLLGREPKRFYPSAYIKAGRFKSLTTIVDDKEFFGTLFQQMEHAMSWFQDRLETRLVIGKPKEGVSLVQREEIWQYPLVALREAIANAVCHRNYLSGAATTIRLYDDRLEIWNPGSLPVDLHAEDLLRVHDSYAPNRLIAESFFNTGVIERWGTGTLMIAQLLEQHGLPAPNFDVTSPHTFRLTIFDASTKLLSKLQTMKLSERQLQAMLYLLKADTLSNSEYQNLFNASRATASRDLAELVSKGLILKEGSTGKGTIYRLIKL
jgi:ATP-dependent DNA helicase RecG